MNTTEQLAVITKKAWFTKNIGLATRTSRLAADCDSGWRIRNALTGWNSWNWFRWKRFVS